MRESAKCIDKCRTENQNFHENQSYEIAGILHEGISVKIEGFQVKFRAEWAQISYCMFA